MPILILIDVQYSQKAVFSFEKGSNHQNHPSSGSFYLLVKKSSPARFTPLSPCHLENPAVGKILMVFNQNYLTITKECFYAEQY